MKRGCGSHERGAAAIGAIMAVIVVVIAIYVAVTMVPIYSAHYKLEDNIKEDILFAQQRFTGENLAKGVETRVIGYLDSMGVTYDKKNVRVNVNNEARSIKVDLLYDRNHKIPGFPKQFQLTVEGKYAL